MRLAELASGDPVNSCVFLVVRHRESNAGEAAVAPTPWPR